MKTITSDYTAAGIKFQPYCRERSSVVPMNEQKKRAISPSLQNQKQAIPSRKVCLQLQEPDPCQ